MTTVPQPVDGLSKEQTEAFRKAQDTIRYGRSLTVLQAMAIKRELKESLLPDMACRRYKQALSRPASPPRPGCR